MSCNMAPQIKVLATMTDSLSLAWDPQVGRRKITSQKLSSDTNTHHCTCAQTHSHTHTHLKLFKVTLNRILTLQNNNNNKQSNMLQA